MTPASVSTSMIERMREGLVHAYGVQQWGVMKGHGRDDDVRDARGAHGDLSRRASLRALTGNARLTYRPFLTSALAHAAGRI